jgi:hypothetical protein
MGSSRTSSNRRFRLACELYTLKEAMSRNAQFIQSVPVSLDECVRTLNREIAGCLTRPHAAGDIPGRISCLIGSRSYCWREHDLTATPLIPPSLSIDKEDSILTISWNGELEDWSDHFGLNIDVWLASHFPVSRRTRPTTISSKIPRTLSEIRSQGVFIIADDLGERLILKTSSLSHAGFFKGSQKVYRRSDCHELKSESQFRVLCRSIKIGEVPRRIIKGGTKLYSIDQTEYVSHLEWIPPQIIGVTEMSAYWVFMETAFRFDSRVLCAPACISGRTGHVIYQLHYDEAINLVSRADNSAGDTAFALGASLEFWRKLFSRVLVDRLVEEKFIQKT